MDTVADHKITEKILFKGRWYVKLQPPFNGQSRIPYANYVWLQGNPSFQDIPKGYVVHHLDLDELNDDISNLVIMFKTHHTAYHFKQKTSTVPVNFNGYQTPGSRRDCFLPTKKPRIGQRPDGAWFVDISEKIDGRFHSTRVSRYQGHKIESQEDAERISQRIWDAR